MRKLMLFVVVALTTVVLPVAAASAAPPSGNELVYLSLGDSVAAGTQQPEPFTDNGYTDVLFQRIAGRMGLAEHINLACPAEDTNEMIDGENGPNGGSLCYGAGAPFPPGGDSQLQATLDVLATRDVGLITITIGANDIFLCGTDPSAPGYQDCISDVLTQAAFNLQAVILPTLRQAAPGVPIVAMNYYNPNLALYFVGGDALADASNGLVTVANGVLAASYGAYGIPVTDVADAFGIYDERDNVIPRNVMLNCRYTLMCDRVDGQLTLSPDADIHPSDIGYRQIAWAFIKTMESEGLL